MGRNLNKKILLNADPAKQFWTADGRAIKNLFGLSRAFEEMSNEVYTYHANENKNDFSSWVQDVFGERRLAKRLGESRTKEQGQVAVLKHLVSTLTKK